MDASAGKLPVFECSYFGFMPLPKRGRLGLWNKQCVKPHEQHQSCMLLSPKPFAEISIPGVLVCAAVSMTATTASV